MRGVRWELLLVGRSLLGSMNELWRLGRAEGIQTVLSIFSSACSSCRRSRGSPSVGWQFSRRTLRLGLLLAPFRLLAVEEATQTLLHLSQCIWG